MVDVHFPFDLLQVLTDVNNKQIQSLSSHGVRLLHRLACVPKWVIVSERQKETDREEHANKHWWEGNVLERKLKFNDDDRENWPAHVGSICQDRCCKSSFYCASFFSFLQWHNLQSPWAGLFFKLIYFLLCICVDTCQSVLQSGVKSCLRTARVIIYKSFSHIRNRKRQGLSEEEEWVYKGLRQKKTWALSLIIEVLFTHSHITCQFLSPHCSCSNCQPSIITTLKIHDADQIITNQLKTFVWCFWAPKHLCRWSWAISFNAPPPKTKEPLFSWSKQWMFVSEILRPHVWSSEWHCWIVRIPKMDKTHPTAPMSI